jgi:hypothetical protein
VLADLYAWLEPHSESFTFLCYHYFDYWNKYKFIEYKYDFSFKFFLGLSFKFLSQLSLILSLRWRP